jgi:hypothetical protein
MGEQTGHDKEVKAKTVEKIAEETAREHMQRLMDSYDIDQNDIVVDQGPEAVDTIINRLVRAIRTGKIEILDNCSIRHNFTNPQGNEKSITYQRLNGRAMRERDKAKGGTLSEHLALMGSLGNVPSENTLLNLDPIDISIIQRLAALFTVV